jgi:transposase
MKDIVLCDFFAHNSLRVGIKQEQLAVGNPVSGSGAAERLFNQRRGTEKLMAKLTAARDCWAKVSGLLQVITVCYEVGYDAFWLGRFLKARGIECLVIDPGSCQVNRRGRRVKTDRVDVKMLLRTLIAWCRGERHVWSLVRIPSVDEEDLRFA